MKRLLYCLPLILLTLVFMLPASAMAQSAVAYVPDYSPKVTYSVRYEKPFLIVDAEHEPEWHTYDFFNTDMGGSSGDTQIDVSGGLEVIGEWKSNPDSVDLNADAEGLPNDALGVDWGWRGKVEFRVKVKRVPGVRVTVEFNGQVCKDSCVPISPDNGGVVTLSLPPYVAEAEETDAGEAKTAEAVDATEKSDSKIDVATLPTSIAVKGGGNFPDELVRYSAEIKDSKLVITAKHAPKWHTYAFGNDTKLGGMSNGTVISLFGGLKLTGELAPSEKAKNRFDAETSKMMGVKGDWAWSGEVTFSAPVERTSDQASYVEISGQVCDEVCINFLAPDESLVLGIANVDSLPITAAAVTPTEAPTETTKETPTETTKEQPATDNAGSTAGEGSATVAGADAVGTGLKKRRAADDKEFAGSEDIKGMSMLAFILFCAGGGLVALLMPCVFPMIPITVSFFAKQAEASEGSTLRIAFMYGLGVVVSYTILGLILSRIWSVAEFGNNFYVALGIGVFFLVFALSMLGAFELRLPHGMAQRFNMQGKASGSMGALLLGLTFAVTSMACTVPVVGAVMAAATSGDYTRPIIGMLVYSSVVALPFVILGAVPGLVQRLPRAGGWMNTVKIIFGLVELAAAAEFFGWAGVISREVVIGVWIGCAFAGSLYLLGLFRGKHDMAQAGIGPYRIVFGIVFAVLGFILIPSLDGTPLRSNFIESFLRGEPSSKQLAEDARFEQLSGHAANIQELVESQAIDARRQFSDLRALIDRVAAGIPTGTPAEALGDETEKPSEGTAEPAGSTSDPVTTGSHGFIKNPALKEALIDAKKEGRPVFIDITGKN